MNQSIAMTFHYSEEQELLLQGFRKFLEKEVQPLAERFRDQLIPVEEMRRIQRAMSDFGVGAGVVDVELGGWAWTQ